MQGTAISPPKDREQTGIEAKNLSSPLREPKSLRVFGAQC